MEGPWSLFHSAWAHLHVQEQTAWRAVASSNPVTGTSLIVRQLFLGGEGLPTHCGAGSSGERGGQLGLEGHGWSPQQFGLCLLPPSMQTPQVCSPRLGFWGLLGTAVGKVIPQGTLSSYSVLGGSPETLLAPDQGYSD